MSQNKNGKLRALCLVLALALILTLAVFAEGESDDTAESTDETAVEAAEEAVESPAEADENGETDEAEPASEPEPTPEPTPEPAPTPEPTRNPDDPVERVRIGLYWGDTALEGANLLNYRGSGYDFGYFDAERRFVRLCGTDATAISMVKDWTVYLVGGQYTSEKPKNPTVTVGCYHIRLGECASLSEAQALADTCADGFVAWMNGVWCACAGSYVSQAEALEAINARELYGTAATASSRCVTVVETDTGRVLFQFDEGGERTLGVLPRPAEDGERPITWFKGHKYYGGFQYSRPEGLDLTVVNFVGMDDYLCGVVPYEMSTGWPLEALKAQAVTARTYTAANLGKHGKYGFDLCWMTDCQSYQGVNVNAADCERAVRETSGIYMTYEGEYAQTFYHSCDGGATEDSENVFQKAIPYLRGREDPYEAQVHTGYEHWSYTYTAAEITDILNQKGYHCARIVSVTPVYTELGNIYSLKFTDANGRNWTFSKDRAGSILFSSVYGKSTRSQRFTVVNADDPETAAFCVNSAGSPVSDFEGLYVLDGSGKTRALEASASVTVMTGSGLTKVNRFAAVSGTEIRAERYLISGSGWGHNVGMSQYGAKAMAELGYTFAEILDFYFNGVTIG